MTSGISQSAQAKLENSLSFGENGICRICLVGLPKRDEIEHLIEDYVTMVELGPHQLKVFFIDISELVHLQAPARQVFSELLIQAAKRYSNQVELVVAGGPFMIRKYTEIFCKALKFGENFHTFENLQEAEIWLKTHLV